MEAQVRSAQLLKTISTVRPQHVFYSTNVLEILHSLESLGADVVASFNWQSEYNSRGEKPESHQDFFVFDVDGGLFDSEDVFFTSENSLH